MVRKQKIYSSYCNLAKRISATSPLVASPKISAIRIIDHSWPRSFENNYR